MLKNQRKKSGYWRSFEEESEKFFLSITDGPNLPIFGCGKVWRMPKFWGEFSKDSLMVWQRFTRCPRMHNRVNRSHRHARPHTSLIRLTSESVNPPWGRSWRHPATTVTTTEAANDVGFGVSAESSARKALFTGKYEPWFVVRNGILLDMTQKEKREKRVRALCLFSSWILSNKMLFSHHKLLPTTSPLHSHYLRPMVPCGI